MLVVPNLLDVRTLANVREVLHSATFSDGSKTAAGGAAHVKRNLQADPTQNLFECRHTVSVSVAQNPVVAESAFPKHVTTPVFSRYEVGMSYGKHVDSSQMAGVRTDLSVTVFLSDPDEYDGGELVVESSETQRIKLPAGFAFVYPSYYVHEVTEVTRGVRSVAVLWMESWIRDEADRSILCQMARIARKLDPDGELELQRLRGELFRRWSS